MTTKVCGIWLCCQQKVSKMDTFPSVRLCTTINFCMFLAQNKNVDCLLSATDTQGGKKKSPINIGI